MSNKIKKTYPLKECAKCGDFFGISPNDRPNKWEKRKFCSAKCCNSRPNKGQYKDGHPGHPNSHSFKKGSKVGEKTRFKSEDVTGEKNPNWKGNTVGYSALHLWVKRWLGKPSKCEHCGKTVKGVGIHWANRTGEYKRDLNDWLRLCSKCHREYDLLNNLINKWKNK